ncbi:MAG TPA: hypothetical protein VMI34_24315 [Candidatus Bathyarchaeia archaeon]|nr:hypothetical protein [Candidatus Bathyarchaeia archaeon]
MATKRLVMLLCGIGVFAGSVVSAQAHGMVGQRFFPATMATDDPFVADELSLPTILYIKTPPSGDSPSTKFTSLRGEFSKRLSPDLQERSPRPPGMRITVARCSNGSGASPAIA